MKSKVCRGCGEKKPIDQFYVNKAMNDGRMSICSSCSSTKSAAYYQANLEKMRRQGREKVRRLRKEQPGFDRKYKLKMMYGMTEAEFEALLASQGGVCAICGTSDPGPRGVFFVDHDHRCCPGKRTCGECVRGLLCNTCNQGIGYFAEDPDRLERAVAYLRAVRREVKPSGD